MSKTKKKFLTLVALCSSGSLFQLFLPTSPLPAGCTQWFGSNLLSTIDFCAILNCTSGTFFNFCEPVRMLVDCP